jgi:hypothetical protein
MSTRALCVVGWALLVGGCLSGFGPHGISPAASLLAALMTWLAVIAWLQQDTIDRRVPLPYDWSWLITISWPVSWIWYARRSHRSWSAAFALAALPLAFPLGGLLSRIAAAFAR